ncbi:MAG: tryptophan synthase subunit beta, partial [Guyparkeria sp.]
MPETTDPMAREAIDYTSFPDARGRFGDYGGRYVAETLMEPIEELTAAYEKYRNDPGFIEEFESDLRDYVGRPTALYHAKRLSELYGAE